MHKRHIKADSHPLLKSSMTARERPNTNPLVTNSMVRILGLLLAAFKISSYSIKAATTTNTAVAGLNETAREIPMAVTKTIIIEIILSILDITL